MNTRTAVIALVVACSVPPVCSAQSLGEIAKKAAEAKAAKQAAAKDGKAAPAPKVLTNKDLTADPTAPAVTATEKESPAAAVKPGAASSTAKVEAQTSPKDDEATWKNRMRTLDTKLADDEMELAAARIHVRDVEAFIRPDGTMSSTIAENLLKAQARRDRALATIANDKRAIHELQEEARKASVPPGWLRWR